MAISDRQIRRSECGKGADKVRDFSGISRHPGLSRNVAEPQNCAPPSPAEELLDKPKASWFSQRGYNEYAVGRSRRH